MKTAKTVFITGGTRGIGQALVHRFKSEEWRVATCSTSQSKTVADLALICDVSNASAVKLTIDAIVQSFGKIDVLINNAAIAGSNSLDPQSNDDLWHRILDINLNGTYYTSKHALPHLPDGSGKIINIASVLALKGVPDQTAYCAAKHGVIGLTRSLATALAPRRITVNAICPGWVRTEMAASRMKELGMKEENLATCVPLGRWIEPSEIADFVFQLSSSPASAMITGQALTIDGGALL